MKKVCAIISMFFVAAALICFSNTAYSKAGDDIKTEPLPISPKKIDLTGTWKYTSSGHKVTGKCPPGKPLAGTMKIVQKGKQVSLSYTSGAVCNPASVCNYSGVLKDNQLTASNTAVVDEEGGQVVNALGLVIMSNKSAHGTSSSRYTHPKGFECHWESKIALSR